VRKRFDYTILKVREVLTMRSFDDDEFDPEALAALEESASMERSVYPEKTGAELAESILEDAAPAAAQSIVRIATSDPNSNTRLRAASYIVDRVLGKAGLDPTKNAPWEDVFKAVTSTMESQS
jgi:hypothetical protein